MKRTLVTLVLLGLAVGGFALDFSAGAGGSLGLLTSYPDFKGTLSGNSVEIKESVTPIDIKAFFDATYIQASVGYMFINGGSIDTMINGVSIGTTDLSGSLSYMTFAAYLKYPFVVGPVTLFPLLGVQYRLNLTYKDKNGNDVKPTLTSQEQADLNELWLEGGAGMDASIGRFFIRLNLLIGFKPLSTTDKDNLSALQLLYNNASLTYFTVDTSLLVGYKF